GTIRLPGGFKLKDRTRVHPGAVVAFPFVSGFWAHLAIPLALARRGPRIGWVDRSAGMLARRLETERTISGTSPHIQRQRPASRRPPPYLPRATRGDWSRSLGAPDLPRRQEDVRHVRPSRRARVRRRVQAGGRRTAGARSRP